VLALALAVLAGTLAGCSDLPDLPADEASACAALVDDLPDPLAGEALTDRDDRTASWGDVELTCGVDRPEEYDEYSPCIQMSGVGWFVPDDELKDIGGDATATALTRTPYVALHVPAERRTAGVDEMLAQLAGPVKAHLEAGRPCR
jgi:hypothetical protein